jgi:hypothetical protein
MRNPTIENEPTNNHTKQNAIDGRMRKKTQRIGGIMKDKGTAPIGISEKESENDELLLRRSIYSAQRRGGGTREFMEPKSDALLEATHS